MAPFRSLILEAARRSGYDITVVQVQRGEHLYRRELAPLVSRYEAVGPDQFEHVVGQVAQQVPGARFYACGSKRLVTAVASRLDDAGVARRDVLIESWR